MAEVITFPNSFVLNGIQTGSPATLIVFPQPVLGFMVDNASGTVPLWVAINRDATTASGNYVIYTGTVRSFGVTAGSVSVLASGTAAGSAQYNLAAGW